MSLEVKNTSKLVKMIFAKEKILDIMAPLVMMLISIIFTYRSIAYNDRYDGSIVIGRNSYIVPFIMIAVVIISNEYMNDSYDVYPHTLRTLAMARRICAYIRITGCVTLLAVYYCIRDGIIVWYAKNRLDAIVVSDVSILYTIYGCVLMGMFAFMVYEFCKYIITVVLSGNKVITVITYTIITIMMIIFIVNISNIRDVTRYLRGDADAVVILLVLFGISVIFGVLSDVFNSHESHCIKTNLQKNVISSTRIVLGLVLLIVCSRFYTIDDSSYSSFETEYYKSNEQTIDISDTDNLTIDVDHLPYGIRENMSWNMEKLYQYLPENAEGVTDESYSGNYAELYAVGINGAVKNKKVDKLIIKKSFIDRSYNGIIYANHLDEDLDIEKKDNVISIRYNPDKNKKVVLIENWTKIGRIKSLEDRKIVYSNYDTKFNDMFNDFAHVEFETK